MKTTKKAKLQLKVKPKTNQKQQKTSKKSTLKAIHPPLIKIKKEVPKKTKSIRQLKKKTPIHPTPKRKVVHYPDIVPEDQYDPIFSLSSYPSMTVDKSVWEKIEEEIPQNYSFVDPLFERIVDYYLLEKYGFFTEEDIPFYEPV